MKEEITSLLNITEILRNRYGRRFTLDGKLVGDIGEVLAREHFHIELHPENTERYDAFELETNRQIQIESTMKRFFSFPYGYVPEYFLAIQISSVGTISTIYNGKGQTIKDYIDMKQLKSYKNSYFSLTLPTVQALDKPVSPIDRIRLKTEIGRGE